jgi:hypothetical protein
MNWKAYIVAGCKPEHQEIQQDIWCALFVMTKSVVKLNRKKASKSFDNRDSFSNNAVNCEPCLSHVQ